jgi:fatty-acyl-CoA synthase
MLSWRQLRGAGESLQQAGELEARRRWLRPGEPANIQFTSGTTGRPKATTLSHRNILNNGLAVGRALGYTAADRRGLRRPGCG